MALLGLRAVECAFEVSQQLFQLNDAVFLALDDAILVNHLRLRGHDNGLERADIITKISKESHALFLSKSAAIHRSKTPPESLCRSWWTGFQCSYAPPIETRKKRFKLRRIKPQNTVFDCGPFEHILLQPLASHDKAGAAPPTD
jgi:hypothetical protein